MAIEVHVNTRGRTSPNWRMDPISAVFVVIHNESAQIDLSDKGCYQKANLLIINRRESANIAEPALGVRNRIHQCEMVKDEFQMYSRVIEIFRQHDPDILFGWETEKMSIGYLCKRAEHGLGFKLHDFISRDSKTF